MQTFIFKFFERLFQFVAILLVTGFMLNVLLDIQLRAHQSQRVGLTSMLKINQQLVGKTK